MARRKIKTAAAAKRPVLIPPPLAKRKAVNMLLAQAALKQTPLVTIFGAGIAGLTAAQELIERGFRVQVVEPNESLFAEGCCEVGGIAATQWAFLSDSTSTYRPTRWQKTLISMGAGGGSGGTRRVKGFVRLRSAPKLPYKIYFDGGRGHWRPRSYSARYRIGRWLSPRPQGSRRIENVPNSERMALLAAEIYDFVYRFWPEPPKIYVVGHTERSTTEVVARRWSIKWANQAKQRLERVLATLLPGPVSDYVDFEVVGMGSAMPIGDNAYEEGRLRNNRVEFHPAGVHVPGDHGYRFFPAFYRNLDDSMRRTPLFDRYGIETGESALSRLKGTAEVAIATSDGAAPFLLPRRRAKSLEELRELTAEMLKKFGYPLKDIALYQLQLFRFLTMSRERRESSLETPSWYEFILGDLSSLAPSVCIRCQRSTCNHHALPFSAEFLADLDKFPQAMAGMRASESDAHTNGLITVQLLKDQFGDGAFVDRVLDGPTSTSWLEHWKKYLRRQGVQFFVGRLRKLRNVNGELQPVAVGTRAGLEVRSRGRLVRPLAEPGFNDEVAAGALVIKSPSYRYSRRSDYYVMALPTDTTWKLLQGVTLPASPEPTTLSQLKALSLGDAFARRRTGPPASGPFRDLTGIQLYFNNDLHFAEGHMYHADSAWRLTSISQPQFWREKGTVNTGYLGVLSIDIGEMHAGDTSMAAWTAFRLRQVAEDIANRVSDESRNTGTANAGMKALLEALEKVCESSSKLEKRLTRFVLDLPRKTSASSKEPWDFMASLGASFRALLRAGGAHSVTAEVLAIRSSLSASPPVYTGSGPLFAAVDAVKHSPPPELHSVHPLWRDWCEVLDGLLTILDSLSTAHLVAQAPYARRALGRTLRCLRAVSVVPYAWQSSQLRIAQSVWRQVKVSLRDHIRGSVPHPLYFRIDKGIRFQRRVPGTPPAVPSRNKSPYLVNIAGEFARRPGVLPDEQVEGNAFYDLSYGKWLVAGGLMKSYTRITSMEHANESARHVVRAILHDVVRRPSGVMRGTMPEYWNPGDFEFDELAFLRRIDAVLYEDERPHLVDILGLEEAIVRWMAGRGSESLDNLGGLLSAVRYQSDKDFAPWIEAMEQSGDPLRRFLEFMARLGVHPSTK